MAAPSTAGRPSSHTEVNSRLSAVGRLAHQQVQALRAQRQRKRHGAHGTRQHVGLAAGWAGQAASHGRIGRGVDQAHPQVGVVVLRQGRRQQGLGVHPQEGQLAADLGRHRLQHQQLTAGSSHAGRCGCRVGGACTAGRACCLACRGHLWRRCPPGRRPAAAAPPVRRAWPGPVSARSSVRHPAPAARRRCCGHPAGPPPRPAATAAGAPAAGRRCRCRPSVPASPWHAGRRCGPSSRRPAG